MTEAMTTTVDGTELRRLRKEAGLTMKTIADDIGVDEAVISRIETGKTRIESLADPKLDAWAKDLHINPARMPRRPRPIENTLTRMAREQGWDNWRRLAEHIGMSPFTMRNYWYDEGKHPEDMASGKLLAIARTLGTTMEHLTGRPEPEEPAPSPPEGYADEPLRWYRRQAGVTQLTLAVRSGQPQTVITGLETGKRPSDRVRARTILDIAAALGVPAANLVRGNHD